MPVWSEPTPPVTFVPGGAFCQIEYDLKRRKCYFLVSNTSNQRNRLKRGRPANATPLLRISPSNLAGFCVLTKAEMFRFPPCRGGKFGMPSQTGGGRGTQGRALLLVAPPLGRLLSPLSCRNKKGASRRHILSITQSYTFREIVVPRHTDVTGVDYFLLSWASFLASVMSTLPRVSRTMLSLWK